MLLDTQLMRIQQVVEVSGLIIYLVNEVRVIRLAASSKLMVLLKEANTKDPEYN